MADGRGTQYEATVAVCQLLQYAWELALTINDFIVDYGSLRGRLHPKFSWLCTVIGHNHGSTPL